ncbi:MAG: prepilin-type N-terminal cleavage/methylation domain-containing protein [Candidatus Rokubacteria bacterium]|nr:prepilin-type N-terminal cleavage/methylation domain-containing protein [Candidatus Rokubacteria bacterium]
MPRTRARVGTPPASLAAAGFTLVELLIGCAVLAVVLLAACLCVQMGTQSFAAGTDQADAQQNARWAMERMVQEIRGAGFNPTGAAFDPVTTQSATALTIQNDWDGSGVIQAAAGACDTALTTEQVRYQLTGTDLHRVATTANGDCDTIVTGGVQSLAFGYFDESGSATADPAAIRTVSISTTVQPESRISTLGGALVTLDDRVRLRNR